MHFFSRYKVRISLLACGWILCPGLWNVQAELQVLPSSLQLRGGDQSAPLLVGDMEDGVSIGDVREGTWSSANPKVVSISAAGALLPVGDGEAVVTFQAADGRTASCSIQVSGTGVQRNWEFRNHVLSVLSKRNCNSGGCHGALAGKGGFRLSLRGYDPNRDHYTLTREAQGRRIELASPTDSLLLTKPTMIVPHKGGAMLEPDSRDFRVLAEWIASGAPASSEKDPVLARLDMLPGRVNLKPGQRHRVVVLATYSDGRVEEVTQWAKFSATDETVAKVDAQTGDLEVIGYGEGAVVAWFSSRIVLCTVTVPYPNNLDPELYRKAPRANLVDDLVLAQLQRLNLSPSPRSSDAEFLRRVHLDVIGRLPTPDEARGFLADASPDKRVKLVDALLARSEFVDYWTYRWADLLLINGRLLRPGAVKAYYEWLRGEVARNTPWDQIARQVVTAQGDSFDQGAVNFYSVHQDPESMAENVSQVFLNLSIGCAKCHNHPLEKWTNDQYYSYANLFARVRAKGWGGDPRNGDGRRTLYVEPRGDLPQPGTGRILPPAPLDGEPMPVADARDRREYLADWLTDPSNTRFSRAIVNRVWAALFGVGLVEPVDDMRISNPPSNPALMQALSDHLVARGFDLKDLMRLLLTSETYQISSRALPGNREDRRHYSHYYPRRLMAEILQDAITDITAVPARFEKLELTDGSTQATSEYPRGTRALELQDSSVDSYFLRTFGRNERAITCECERSNTPSMVQVLHLSNGEALNASLSSRESRLSHLDYQSGKPGEWIEDAYLRCLSRYPTSAEKEGLVEVFRKAGPKAAREVLEDLYWALMTSREFLFQH